MRPHAGLHWSCELGYHCAGQAPVPPAHPDKQSVSVVIWAIFSNTSAIVQSSASTCLGGLPPICAAACALAVPRLDIRRHATEARAPTAIQERVVVCKGERGGGGGATVPR